MRYLQNIHPSSLFGVPSTSIPSEGTIDASVFIDDMIWNNKELQYPNINHVAIA